MTRNYFLKIVFCEIVILLFLIQNIYALTDSPTTIHVPADQPNIQAGIDAAVNGDTVLVADGIYSGTGNLEINFGGKEITLASESGFENCIIDCENTGPGFNFYNNETADSILTGFTIQNGWNYFGGGIYISYGAAPLISDCLFTDCESYNGGGAVNCYQASPTFVNCEISGNLGDYGGGILLVQSDPLFINCNISNNTTDYLGGGAAYFTDSSPTLINCTLTVYYADYLGGAFYCQGYSSPVFTNCIIYGNNPDEINCDGGDPVLIYTNIQGGFPGTGNINNAPLFTTGPLGNYYLSHTAAGQSEDSPCLDTGSDLAENICFESAEGQVCLNDFTTRTDGTGDTGQVDIGYHYPTITTPTPTPTATTPSTSTPTGIPTATPSFTPTPMNTPTSTPSCTSTPVDTPTPTLTPTHTGIPDKGIELILDDRELKRGDLFHLHFYLHNPDSVSYSADVWVLLDVMGAFWCYPSWVSMNESVDFNPNIEVDSQSSYHEDVLSFDWPEVSGSVTGLQFYGAAFQPDSFEIIGEIQIIEWAYN